MYIKTLPPLQEVVLSNIQLKDYSIKNTGVAGLLPQNLSNIA